MKTKEMSSIRHGAVRSWVPTAVALCAVLTLAGCATPSAFQSPDVKVPQTWQQGVAAQGATQADQAALASLQPWWLEMQDASLTQVIEDALARNNDLAQAAIRVR